MKALYRKYRPLKLADVVGQEQVTDVLAGSIKQGKINHAYLFTGPRGTGKTTVARIFAHEINQFEYQLEDDYVDIVEIDGASNRGVDNIRDIREKAMIAPSIGKYKVYIIDEVHMLTKEAFNALLKTLEEPPEHVIFIMATTDAYKVPITITSRAQVYTFKLATPEIIKPHLKKICEKESVNIEDSALDLIVKRGGGSFRDSLSLLDQISTMSSDKITQKMVESALGLPEDEVITDLLAAYREKSVVKITTLLKDLFSSGIKPEIIAEELITKIIESPEPDFMPLLEKLPDVKAPFEQARLLYILAAPASNSAPFTTPAPVPSTRPASVPSAAPAVNPMPQNQPATSAPTPFSPAQPAPSATFDWPAFIEKINSMNDAIALQLKDARFELEGSNLIISPAKKFAKVILGKTENLRFLSEVSGKNVKLSDSNDSTSGTSVKKDSINSKISDIMGGEVQDYGGGNPF